MSRKWTLEQIENRYIPEPNSGCWLWLGSPQSGGYGRFSRRPAHIVLYEFHIGPIPAGLQLDHKCRVRSCVNPNHLEPVTCRVNLLRGETLAAQNAAKTHCINGHEFSGDNLITLKSERRCRACFLKSKHKSYLKHAEKNRAYSRQWKAKNSERHLEYMRKYRERLRATKTI